MSVKGQVKNLLKNIGIGQVTVIKQKSVKSSWGGHAKLNTISNSVVVIGGETSRYLHTVIDNDRVIVVRLPYDAPKPDRTYDERLKNEY